MNVVQQIQQVQQSVWVLAGGLNMADPGIEPKRNGLPGMTVLEKLVGGLMFGGLIVAVAALIISAIVWAFGSFGANHQAASRGKTGVLVSIAAAVLIGGADALIGWGSTTGGEL